MRKRLFLILLLVAPLLGGVGGGYLFSQDYVRLSERTIMGTARYVGMGGAMTAIGGDPSAVLDNTGGLGLYRRTETTRTFDYAYSKATSNAGRLSFFMAPQASVVFSMPTGRTEGVLFHNFMLSYSRQHTFNRSMRFEGGAMPSMGALFAEAEGNMGIPFCADRYNTDNYLKLSEGGSVNEYAFDWAMNVSDRVYWGLGLRIHSFSLTSEADYIEYFDEVNVQQQAYYNRNRSTVMLNGAACSFSTGLIARPASWLRFGLALQTPSFGAVNIITEGTFDAQTDTLRWSDAPRLTDHPSDFHMPFRLSTSVAFQITHYALISLQYDLRTFKKIPTMHSLRAGVEIVPVGGIYINLGYAYESTFKNSDPVFSIDPTLNRQDAYYQYTRWQQYISGAVGYRGRHFFIQAAYQYHHTRKNVYAHEQAIPYHLNDDAHRVVFTIGWHRSR